MKNSDPKKNILYLIIIFAIAIRVYFFRQSQAEINVDCYMIAKLAKGVLQGNYETMGRFHHFQPLYPILMAILNFAVGDLLSSGKIISLLSGVATVPVTYLLWKKLETNEVALLAATFVAVNTVGWYHSIHVFRDSLFLFFATLSFLFLFEAKEDIKWLPFLAITLGLATLTHLRGFILTTSIVLSFLYWNRSYILEKTEIEKKKIYYINLSVIIYTLLVLPWHLFRLKITGELYPSNFFSGINEFYGHAGLKWIPTLANSVTLPLFILALIGIILTHNKKEKYLPLYLFVILFSLSQSWFGGIEIRYMLPIIPLILGWSSLALDRVPIKRTQTKHAILSILVLLLFINSFTFISRTDMEGESGEVVKDSMEWFNSYSDKNAKIWVGNGYSYEYYTDRELIWYNDVSYLIRDDLEKRGVLNHEEVFLLSFIRGDVHYYAVHNFLPLPPWFNSKGDEFTSYRFIIDDKELTFSPLKKIKKNNYIVYIFRVDW